MTGVPVRDRRKALLLLAGSRYEVYAPGPKIGRAFAAGAAAATKKELCLLCDGDKVTRDKFGRESTCESCKGRGWHKVDLMLNKEHRRSWEQQYQETARTRRALCDRCAGSGVWKQGRCEMCDGAGKVSVPIHREPLSKADREVDVALSEWERMMVRRESEGSYVEYDRCVAELARRSPHRHGVFHRAHVLRNAGVLSGTESIEVERAIVQLLEWMPDEILVPGEIVAADRREKQDAPRGKGVSAQSRATRDDEIIQRALINGESVQALAADLGLSERTIQRVLDAAA